MKFYTIMFALLLTSCGNNNLSDVKHANDETLIRYVICSAGETNCFVAARFKDLDSCQSHKEWADMLCDKLSTPGKMICSQNNLPKIGIAYCTL
jgi:hypothetical protein